MKNSSHFFITDHVFHQTISCPLKLHFNLDEDTTSKKRDPFRQLNKLALRDAIAQRFSDLKQTDDRVEKAAEQTQKWLKLKNVTICGAVIKTDQFLTRIPILRKQGDELTVMQVHGKLNKHGARVFSNPDHRSHSITRYLLKAAYRCYVLQSAMPNLSFRAEFFMPNAQFKSGVDDLFQQTVGRESIPELCVEQLAELFPGVDGTESVYGVMNNLPESHVHRKFSNGTVGDACSLLLKQLDTSREEWVPGIHDGCKFCQFRMGGDQNRKGCWEKFYPAENLKHGDNHTYELIGHTPDISRPTENYFQENIELPAGLESLEKIKSLPGNIISIQQRRALQLLKVKGHKTPLLWGKPLLKKVQNLKYPLHFIDFEAATTPVPMAKGRGAYDPILFQFSCHTLFKNGEITHTEWLDEHNSSYPHASFIEAICSIPKSEKGTFVQFSPFERQTFYRLLREIEAHDVTTDQTRKKFRSLITGDLNGGSDRFFDISKFVRDGYYNRFMDRGLTLKESLVNILKVSKRLGLEVPSSVKLHDKEFDLSRLSGNGVIVNPYKELSGGDVNIGDGAVAMNAYLSYKSGLISEEDRKLISVLLKRYCALDSYSLYIIFSHFLELFREFTESGEILLMNEIDSE